MTFYRALTIKYTSYVEINLKLIAPETDLGLEKLVSGKRAYVVNLICTPGPAFSDPDFQRFFPP